MYYDEIRSRIKTEMRSQGKDRLEKGNNLRLKQLVCVPAVHFSDSAKHQRGIMNAVTHLIACVLLRQGHAYQNLELPCGGEKL